MKKFEEYVNEDKVKEDIWHHNLKVRMSIHDSSKSTWSESTVLEIDVEQDTAEKISTLLRKDKLNDGLYKITWKPLEDLHTRKNIDYSSMI